MKKEERRMILILVIVTIVIIGVVYLLTRPKQENKIDEPTENIVEEFTQVLEDGTKLNTSTKLSEMKEIEGIKIGNIQLTEKGDKTELIAEAVNESGKESAVMLIDIILYDKEGRELVTLGGIINPMEVGGRSQFSTSSTLDYANAYDFKIVKK